MSGTNREIIVAAHHRAGMNEPIGIPSLTQAVKDFCEKIVTLNPLSPEYPLKQPFNQYYASALSGTSEQYARKYTLARTLLADGRFQDVKMLDTAFIPQGEEVSPEVQALKDDLHIRVRQKLLERGDEEETAKAASELVEFAEAVEEGETLDAQEFRKIVGLFGGSRAADILYRTRPEFRGMRLETVNGVLGDYLGNVLNVRGRFDPDNLDIARELLSESTFLDDLYVTIKDDCLQHHNNERKAGSKLSSQELTAQYFELRAPQVHAVNFEPANQTLERARRYYASLWELPKSPRIVDSLKPGRLFPDLNQLINMQEVADNRREALADDMGLGKSASLIFAKELLGIKCALIVAPPSVIPTWQKYLSDKVENGKQVGYFKKGIAPEVATIDSLKALHQTNFDTAEYVLISHDRLNDTYTPVLEQHEFGLVAIDEVHKLKNITEGVRARHLLRLDEAAQQHNAYVALLSGTPSPNKVQDIAMILKLLYPEQFKEMSDNDLVRSIIDGKLHNIRSLLLGRMQMKRAEESLDLPPLIPNEVRLTLSQQEKEAYEVLLEDDELEATDKLRILRQFLLNPRLLDATPGIESTKINAVNQHLNEVFQDKSKVVMFVNGYVEGIIRGDGNILEQMKLPKGVEIRVIHGDTPEELRQQYQNEFNNSDKKILLVVSGQTMDVGVDLSAGEEVVFYNEPWSEYEKQQQLRRVYREGVKQPVRWTSFITEGTIEEGIHLYIQMKYRAIEKLLRGVPTSEVEREILRHNEKQEDPNLEVNPELAKYYFSSWHKMLDIFRSIKEMGEKEFSKFIARYGKDYADCYVDLGSRSYQANACRIDETIIANMIQASQQDPNSIRILDIASGPEMLKKHIANPYQDRVISLDINRLHFTGEGGKRIVGSFAALPVESGSIDYANMSLALHYSIFIPSRGQYERLRVLAEMNRVLKIGGKAVINLMYNRDIKDLGKFNAIAQALGFRVVDAYTGEVVVGKTYRSRVITLEKVADVDSDINKIIEGLERKDFDGIKFLPQDLRLKDSRKIIREFNIDGKTIPINFNQEDRTILEEEERITTDGERLKELYRGVKNILRDDVVQNGFARILIGDRYALFKKLQNNNGVVIIR